MFHFSRSHGVLNPPPLDLMPLGGPILCPKSTWHYLRFIFDQKLLFQQHIDFYTNKTILTIKCMKILGNSLRGLVPIQKRCIYSLKEVRKMQRRAALWISDTFIHLPYWVLKPLLV